MVTINAGVIGSDMTEEFFEISSRNTMEKFLWKKIYVPGAVASSPENAYAGSEVVDNVEAIISDTDISLVFVSSNHLNVVQKMIEAGKSVRVI